MDADDDALSAAALVLHAATAREDGKVSLDRLRESELDGLWGALETVRNAVADEMSRRLRAHYLGGEHTTTGHD